MNPLYDPVNRIYNQFKVVYEKSNAENKIENEKFPEPVPKKPVRKLAQFEEIKVSSNITKPKSWYWEYTKYFFIAYAALTIITGICNVIMFAIFIFLLPVAAVVAIGLRIYRGHEFDQLIKEDVIRIKASKAYKDEYQRRLDAQKHKQKKFDSEYESENAQYEKSYDLWKEHKKSWESDRDRRYEEAVAEYLSEKYILYKMFNEFGKIPKQYRFMECIEYIRDVLATSDVDIKTALEMYDRERQRKLENERIVAMNRHNDLQEQYNAEMEYQSELHERANDIAQKHRREAAALGAYNAYQNHKQTKILEKREKERQRAIERAKRGY